MGKYVIVDNCPVPEKLAPVLRLILKESGARLQSCYRANDAISLLHLCGKQSQTELYNGWLRRLPGYNPANPPGRSTHELKNDGVAYATPAGIPLPYWCVGIDVDDAHVQAFIKAARKHGYIASITYPTSKLEYHHVNFRKEPRYSLPALKRGSKGPRVKSLTINLALVHSPKTGKPYLTHKYWTFTANVEKAVKAYQIDHHLHGDGIIGPATVRQLATSVRYWKKRKK